MRRDLWPEAGLLIGALSLAALAASPRLLDAADLGLPLPSRSELQPHRQAQIAPEPSPPQPMPQAELPAAAKPSGRPADNPSPAPAQPDSTAADRPEMVVLHRRDAQSILGREARSAAGENMGRIVDVIVDRAGNARAAVIDFGGFLGVGSRKIAVAWNALHFATADGSERITLGFTRDQVKATPAYQEGQPIVVLGTSDDTGRFRVTSTVRSEQ